MNKANEFEIVEFMMTNFKHSVGVELASPPESVLVNDQGEAGEDEDQQVCFYKFLIY